MVTASRGRKVVRNLEAERTASANKGNDTGPLSGLQVIVGLFTGLAALIYFTGGAALGLRLQWAGLPALPVGQLPREFLFSLGAAQVVLPALAVGLVVGLLELGQDLRGLREGHLPWSDAKQIPSLRRTYIAFYGLIPFVLISPGIAITIRNDDDIATEWPVLGALAGTDFVLLLAWIVLQRMSRLTKRDGPDENAMHELRWLAWSAILAPGLLVSLGFAFWMWYETGGARYLGILGAWAVALFFALLVVWLRGFTGKYIREHYPADGANPSREDSPAEGDDSPEDLSAVRTNSREDLPPEGNKRLERPRAKDVPPWVVVLSWCASALLAVPALIAVTAAWPLTDAVVCVEQVDHRAYPVYGNFVGETKDRVYIGDDKRRLISFPTSKVSRVLVGGDAVDQSACQPSGDVISAPK